MGCSGNLCVTCSIRRLPVRGLLFCSDCGYRLVGQARKTRRIYRCNNVDRIVGSHECKGFTVDANRIEQPVWDTLASALRNPMVLRQQYSDEMEQLQVASDYGVEQKQLQLALKRIVNQEDRITDAYRNDAMELDRYKSEMENLRNRRETTRSQLTDLEKR